MTPILLTALLGSAMAGSDPTADVNALIDGFHAAAEHADAAAYFGAMTDDFVFVGTDATERWDKPAFQAFAAPYFAKPSAWTYHPLARNVTVRGDVAWFDERLDNPKYGEARGSGVAVQVDGAWKLSQYVLSFPIPNELAPELLERIRARN